MEVALERMAAGKAGLFSVATTMAGPAQTESSAKLRNGLGGASVEVASHSLFSAGP